MDISICFKTWGKEQYHALDEILIQLCAEKYRKSDDGTINTKYKILGVRVPYLRELAKSISSGNAISFLNNIKVNNFEKLLLYGLVATKLSEEEVFYYYEQFLEKVDNWCACDIVCGEINAIQKNPKKYFTYALNLAKSDKEFICRAGIIHFLKYYKKEPYVDEVLRALNRIKIDAYYVSMGEAWLLAEMYLYSPAKVLNFLVQNKLSKFAHNKAIQKMRESFRISEQDKDELNLLKRK